MIVTLWEMVKGWLDPRTQNKIEFISPGPEVNKRLLEFIDPEELPEIFGGNAPNMHMINHRPHADYVHIPRSSAIKKHVTVPPNHKLTVETYTLETNCDITLKIFRKVHPANVPMDDSSSVFTNVSHHHQHNHETISNYDCGRILQTHAGFQLVTDKEIKIAHTQPAVTEGEIGHHYVAPTRLVYEYTTSATQGEEYIVTWNNTAMFVTRPLTYNLMIDKLDVSSEEKLK